MKKAKVRRPGFLLRMYKDDLARLSKVCADQCTPRENYARRAVLQQLEIDEAFKSKRNAPKKGGAK